MSGGQSGYELTEAKAILTELKSIRKAISSGEKEKQDLMQVCHRAPCQLLTPWPLALRWMLAAVTSLLSYRIGQEIVIEWLP